MFISVDFWKFMHAYAMDSRTRVPNVCLNVYCTVMSISDELNKI